MVWLQGQAAGGGLLEREGAEEAAFEWRGSEGAVYVEDGACGRWEECVSEACVCGESDSGGWAISVRGCSSAGRAREWHSRGPGFDLLLLQFLFCRPNFLPTLFSSRYSGPTAPCTTYKPPTNHLQVQSSVLFHSLPFRTDQGAQIVRSTACGIKFQPISDSSGIPGT